MSDALESLILLRKDALSEPLPHTEAGWIDSLRRDALACFEEQGVPTRRLEEWKGTNFAPLSSMQFTRVGPSEAAITSRHDALGDLAEDQDPLLVFIDGRFDHEASRLTNLPAGLRAMSLAEVLANEPEVIEGRLAALTDLKVQPLVALQTAFLSDGGVLIVERDTQIERPIRLQFISTRDSAHDSSNNSTNSDPSQTATNSASFPRLLVLAGSKSSLTLLQEHVCDGEAPGLTAYVAELHLADGAHVESLEIQAEDATRIHFTSTHARLEANATFDSHVISVGNGLVRSELAITLAEPDSQTTLCGLFFGRDNAHLDHFTTVDHAAERCTSDEEYRGILAGESKGVFRGRVLVRPGAQKTDAKQQNANLLLSDRATIDTKPQLEIYADDIRASHGSTIGQLDMDALFFLRTRGVGLEEAKRLLTGAFAHGVVARIKSEALRQTATLHIDAALNSLSDPTRGMSRLAHSSTSEADRTDS